MSPPGPYPGFFSRFFGRDQEPAENRHNAAISTVTVRPKRTRTTLLTLPVAAITMGLTSCSLFSSQTTTATKDLEVGQCYNTVSKDSGGDQAIGEVVVVDCSKAHTYEVIAQTTFSDDIKDFPKQQARDSLGQGFCLGEDFTKYVGIESGKTSYQVEYLTPGEGTWAQGDRKITCVVTQGDKSQVKGSAKNSKK